MNYFLFLHVQTLFSKMRHLAISLKGPPGIQLQRTENDRAGNRHFLFPTTGWLCFVFWAGKVKLKVVCVCSAPLPFQGTGVVVVVVVGVVVVWWCVCQEGQGSGGTSAEGDQTHRLKKIIIYSWLYANQRHLEYKNINIQRRKQRRAVETGGGVVVVVVVVSQDRTYRNDLGKELLKLY